MNDRERLEILKRAAAKAPEAGHVALRTQDVRWLVSLAKLPPSGDGQAESGTAGASAAHAALDWEGESDEDNA